MKRYIWLLVGVMLAAPAVAQQIPLYSQYSLNPFLYNPARTGQRDGLNANLIYRKMWTDIQGAPETRAITLDGSVVNKKVGLGGYVYQDFQNIIQRTAGYLSYAYHIKLKEDMHLSLGLSVGVVDTRVDWANAHFGDNTIDKIQGTTAQNGVAFDAALGINYQWKGLNVGFAVPQLFNGKAKSFEGNNSTLDYQLQRHYLLSASYEANIKDRFYIEPAMMFRTIEGKAYQIDIGSSFSYKRIVWLNVMYRYDYAVAVGVGVRIHDRLSLGYTYDIQVNNMKNNGGGTHEVFVGIKFGKKQDVGLVEEIKKMQQTQKDQGDRLDKLEPRVDTLEHKTAAIQTKNDSLAKNQEKLQKQLDERYQTLEELQEKVGAIVKKIADEDAAKTGGKPMEVPANLIYKGNKEDLEFITGKPDANYFMVVSSMRTEDGARKIAEGLQANGHKVGVVYNKRRTWYYIFLDKPESLENGLKELYKIRKETEFKDAWIHIYE